MQKEIVLFVSLILMRDFFPFQDDFQTLLRLHGHGASDNEEGKKEAGGVTTEKSKKTGL